MSLDGTVVAVGAWQNNGNGTNSGHVRLFRFAQGTWLQLGTDINGETAGDQLGFAVALSGNGTVLAAGANGYDSVNGVDSGRVVVFCWDGNAWRPMGGPIDGKAQSDGFGNAVALSKDGAVVAVGATFAGPADNGLAQVWAWNGDSEDWVQRGTDLEGVADGDRFGITVSLSSNGSTVACGASLHESTGIDAGHVRVFRWTGSAWTQLGTDIVGLVSNGWFGRSVSLSGDGSVIAVGANNGGQCRVFLRLSTTAAGGYNSGKPLSVQPVVSLVKQWRCRSMAEWWSLVVPFTTRDSLSALDTPVPFDSHPTTPCGSRLVNVLVWEKAFSRPIWYFRCYFK